MKRSVAVRANIRQVKRAFQQPNGQSKRAGVKRSRASGQQGGSNGQINRSNEQIDSQTGKFNGVKRAIQPSQTHQASARSCASGQC